MPRDHTRRRLTRRSKSLANAYLNAEEHRPDLKGRRPLILEDIQADAAKLIDVGVVYLGQKTNLASERPQPRKTIGEEKGVGGVGGGGE